MKESRFTDSQIESELSQLKRMYADLALENRAMKDLIEKSFIEI